MYSCYSSIDKKQFAETKIYYGQQDNIASTIDKISSIEDPRKRNIEINTLLEHMEQNSSENSFLNSSTTIHIPQTGNGFKLDDPNLYYLFFDVLKALKKKTPPYEESYLTLKAVITTIKIYFGGLNNNATIHDDLTYIKIDGATQDCIIPSISNQKGKNCSSSVERASTAHNLWLLLGYKSYFIIAMNCSFTESQSSYIGPHSFCIIEQDNKFKLFDSSTGIYKKLEGNPIECILKGQPLTINTDNKNNYIYASGVDLTKENYPSLTKKG